MKTMLLLCALVVGSNAWADADVTYDFANATVSGSTVTASGVSFSGYGKDNFKMNSGYFMIGKTGSYITFPTYGSPVEKIVVTGRDGASASTKMNIFVGETAVSTETTGSTGANTYKIASASQAAGTTYTLKVTSNHNAQITKIEVFYAGGGGGSSVTAPSFSPAAGAVDAGTKVSISHADGGTIRYTTDGTDPTKTTGTEYTAPITITTATTFKAIAIKGDDVSDVVTAAYTISVTAPAFNIEGGSYLVGTSVTITSAGNAIYYTTDGSTPSNTSTEYTGPLSIAAGKATYKAIAYDTYGNASSVITRTYTGITAASLPFSWTGTSDKGKEDLAEQNGLVVNLGGNYAASNAPYRLKFDTTSKYVIIYTNEKPEAVSFTAKLFMEASTGTKMKVQASADGIDFTDIEEFTVKGDKDETFEFTTSNAFASTDRVVKIFISEKDQNVAVGSISVSCAPVAISISDAGLATFACDKALDFTSVDGIEAYVAKEEAGAVKLTKVNKVPAGTGVLLRSTSGGAVAKDVPVAASADAIAENIFVRGTGATVATDAGAGKTNYVLGKKSGVVGFYKANGATVGADKAYLQTTVSAARINIDFDDATAIETVKAQNVENGQFFNLAGQRVAQPTKGLYIVNGKKVIIK